MALSHKSRSLTGSLITRPDLLCHTTGAGECGCARTAGGALDGDGKEGGGHGAVCGLLEVGTVMWLCGS